MTCYDAYKNLYVESHDGHTRISPCCLSPTIKTARIDFFQNSYLQEARQAFDRQTWPESCATCQKTESLGGYSRRQGGAQWYKDHGLDNTDVDFVRLDYWVGDLCNLACAICGPHFSSSWKQHLGLPVQESRVIVNDFWQDLDVSNIRYVHFTGGEPLLNKEHVRFLRALPNKEKIQLSYNTNGTVLPKEELNDLWLQFRLVELVFSIDDVGTRFNYQRWPADWQQVEQNLRWYIEHGNHNSMYAVNTTVSVLNQPYLHELDSWLEANFKQTKFTDPINHLRQPYTGMKFAPGTDVKIIRKYLDDIDRARGTDWRSVFPEFNF